ncbi:HEAT repeat domain-containing protein [Mastigocoleus testarum]|uniref:Uncharacterized protein n=1 Tax=Mastigocoleus testarum BC008 TaxID=371196 RepID=A0A0V7ZW21_9CYAN|nr:HEAT repeat domain-containing protein [Mastigocoleus testarum]KST64509.1 hypothetical protein BC008_17935 [Mastigocoleus testarum BC008]KST68761.1 hypothetical protein BC008_02035 [Mastigocoleus testarum BC008]
MSFNTRFRFSFLRTQKFTVRIAILLLLFSSPLFFWNASWGQNITSVKSQQKPSKIPENSEISDNINTELKKFNSQYSSFEDKKEAIYVLRKYLKDPKKQVRITALDALSAIGTGADDALDDLKYMIKTEQDPEILSNAITTIGSINATHAISELIDVFKDEKQDLQVRLSAGEVITYTEENKKLISDLIPWLLDVLKNPNVSETKLRIKVAKLLSKKLHQLKRKQYPEETVEVLTEALKDPTWRVRSYAADTLGNIGFNAESSIDQLVAAYNRGRNNTMKNSVIGALGDIGSSKRTNNKRSLMIVTKMTNILKDEKNINIYIFTNITDALTRVVVKLEQNKTNHIKPKQLNGLISNLEKALVSIEKSNFNSVYIQTDTVNLRSSLERLQHHQVINEIIKNPSVWGLGVYLISLFGIFWLRPLWLLKIDKALKSVGYFKLPVIDKEISLNWLLLTLKYRPRVLDAWVQEYLKSVQNEFEQKDTVSDRNVYISIPVVRDKDKPIAELKSEHLRSTFDKKRGCLLIQGEGGVGKTSLACQIAKWAMSDDKSQLLCKHRMLPVLIEEDLEISNEIEIEMGKLSKSPLIAALIDTIQGQLQDLTDEIEPVSEELLERLLRERRILVIVDHLSEMNETTRKAIRPESPDFPINALVVTSRSEENLGKVTKTTLKPLRIQGDRLSSFMEAYLTQANKRELFTDTEFFQACSGLSQMVGERNITALLAKLYADQLIATKVEGVQQVPLQKSENIPDLMLWYLNELNRTVLSDYRLTNPTIQQDAKVIAWECVKRTFQPTDAQRDKILASLQGDDAELRLIYFEKRLRIIQTTDVAQKKIRFALDPLAEYLAAMHFVELCQHSNNHQEHNPWNDFSYKLNEGLIKINLIKGFCVALYDYCQILVEKEDEPVLEVARFILQQFEKEKSPLKLLINPSTSKSDTSQEKLIRIN